MTVPNSQSCLQWEEVQEDESTGTKLLKSCEPREHPRCWASGRTALKWVREPRLRRAVQLETHLAGREQAGIRQIALCELLLDEHQQHQQELSQLGKAFYVERL